MAIKRTTLLAISASALLAILAGGCGGGSSSSSSGGGGGGGNSGAVSVSISPTSADTPFGGTKQFTATVTGSSNTAVTWSVSAAGATGNQAGTISSAGLYTAPSETSLPQPSAQPTLVSVSAGATTSNINVTVPALNPVNSVTVTATSQADNTKSASATVALSGLSLIAVGQCTPSGTNMLSCTGGVTGVQASRGTTVDLFIVGYGIVAGTTYSISTGGSVSDVTVTQPPANHFGTTTDGLPETDFNVVISPTATLGSRNILVKNSAGEISAFPGGLEITQ